MAYVMSMIFLLMSIGSMSHVDFKKWPCHPVDFRGLGPAWRGRGRVGGRVGEETQLGYQLGFITIFLMRCSILKRHYMI